MERKPRHLSLLSCQLFIVRSTGERIIPSSDDPNLPSKLTDSVLTFYDCSTAGMSKVWTAKVFAGLRAKLSACAKSRCLSCFSSF